MKYKWNVKTGVVKFENGKTIKLEPNITGGQKPLQKKDIFPNLTQQGRK